MLQSRQLAAIMFTDIVGYTALMEENEQLAFEILEKNRKLQRPIIERYGGRWLKEIGDGVLASFSTISDSVYCAIEIQETCHDDPDLNLRIGINQGEVIFAGNDVFGSGVNIASRLEPLAPIGGILVSESVHNNVLNKKGIVSTFVGEKNLKGVREALRVYQIQVRGVESLGINNEFSLGARKPSLKKLGILIATVLAVLFISFLLFDKFINLQEPVASLIEPSDKSIAVLPFRNESPDPDNEYFCNGMVEEILNYLQNVSALDVKARTSAEQYKNPSMDIKEIAKELEVAFIVEGSVRKSGDDLRITVQLIEAETGNHLWSETYDGKYTEKIFEFQSGIAKKIAASLNAIIIPHEEASFSKHSTTDVRAYDYILQAREVQWKYWTSGDTMALNLAAGLYKKALNLDPDYSLGWVKLGSIYIDRHRDTEDYFERNYLDSTLWYCNKAIEANPSEAEAYSLKGITFHKRGDVDLAVENYQRALDISQNLNQSQAKVMFETFWRLGYLYICQQDYVKGISLIRKAVHTAQGSPRDYRHMISRLGYAYILIGAFEEAENEFIKAMQLGYGCWPFGFIDTYQSNFQASIDRISTCCTTDYSYVCYNLLAYDYLQLREFETAIKYLQNLRNNNVKSEGKLNHLYREGYALLQLGRKEEGMKLIEKQLSQLEKRRTLGRPDGFDYHLAAIHAIRGNVDKALQHLRNYEKNMFFPESKVYIIPISFAQYDIMFENLWENNDFKEIIRNDQEEKAAVKAQLWAD